VFHNFPALGEPGGSSTDVALKEIGRYLGCAWADENASGLQALVWRGRWEQTRAQGWKDKLVTYNAEDCAALKKVTEFVQTLADAARSRGAEATPAPDAPKVVWADQIAPSNRHPWCRPKFALQDFDHVNRCAYFDYQRDKVFIRTSKAVRRACLSQRKAKKRSKPPANKEMVLTSDSRPFGGEVRGRVVAPRAAPGELLDGERLDAVEPHRADVAQLALSAGLLLGPRRIGASGLRLQRSGRQHRNTSSRRKKICW
jgi:hypothetical protein